MRQWMRSLLVAVAAPAALSGTAHAAPPPDVSYQGRLLDGTGDALTGPVTIEIGIWSQLSGGILLYGETHENQALSDGVFAIVLGTGAAPTRAFDAELFDGPNRFLEVTIDGETLTPRQPLTSVPYALQSQQSQVSLVADRALDADTLGGVEATLLDQSAHVADTINPHGVSAAQVGAATPGDVDGAIGTHASDPGAHHAKTETFGELSDQIADAQLPDSIARDDELAAEATARQDGDAVLQGQVDALQAQVAALNALLEDVTRSGDTLEFSGMNVQIVNGAGSSDTLNGLGNLIVGYNEDVTVPVDRTGSHNVVIGVEHSYSSFGGLVAGRRNTISEVFASVTGGVFNTASGQYASVSGGSDNTASDTASSVSGGAFNEASREYASVSGGRDGIASGIFSSVSGGRYNETRGSYSSVSGGGGENAADGNITFASYSAILGGEKNRTGIDGESATGEASTVSGGSTNTSSGPASSLGGGFQNFSTGTASSLGGGFQNFSTGTASSVSGGVGNRASGDQSSVSGGAGNEASGNSSSVGGGVRNEASGLGGSVSGGADNTAFADYSAILGGERNETGIDGTPDTGEGSTVSGGFDNTASGQNSSVSGGSGNLASGNRSSVSGGNLNTAGGARSSVSGGASNTADGFASSVSGGRFNQANGANSSVAGGGGDETADGNTAFANYSAILGGRQNETGTDGAPDTGEASTVGGGFDNTASGQASSVSGGDRNTASELLSSVTGGTLNNASGNRSSVTGGENNTASGGRSSVSGGFDRSVTGPNDWRAGDLFESF
ncbi:MAG: hypothetical protein QNK03_26230 [Myxococcota bacterium]|nr:hypothetical protein [Myxococcota bacterium]